jgi:transcription antitermination factor NusG
MFDKKFEPGQRVKIKPHVKPWGGKTGTVLETDVQLGYPVVSVKILGFPRSVTFAPEELELQN